MIFQIIFKKYSRFIRVIRGLLLFQQPPQRGGVRGGVWMQSIKPKAQSPMPAWQPPLPFLKGEGSGVGVGCKAQSPMRNDFLAASPPLSQEAAEKVQANNWFASRWLYSNLDLNKLTANFVIFQIIFKKYSRFIRVIRGLLLFQQPPQRGGVRGGVWMQSIKPKAQSPMPAWQPPLPFLKGEGSGVGVGCKAQSPMRNDFLAASPPLSQEAAEKVQANNWFASRWLYSNLNLNKSSANFVIFQIIFKKNCARSVAS